MMPTPNQLRQYQRDPVAFFGDLVIDAPGAPAFASVWAPFQVEMFRAIAPCLLAVAAGEKPPWRGAWIERTKGASKDSDVAVCLLWLMLFTPRPILVELAADDQDQILETHKAIKDFVRLNPWTAERVTIQATRILSAGGSECAFLTKDASGSHGSRPDVTVVNELSHITTERFAQTVMDNADKRPGNLCVVATNAGQLTTWQHRWREAYRQNPRWYFQKVDAPAQWIDAANLAEAKVRNPMSRYKRLWEGLWVPPGGDALSAEAIQKCVVYDAPMAYLEGDYNGRGIGVDIGTEVHHSGLVVLLTDYARQKVRVACVKDFAPPVSLTAVKGAILDMARQFDVKALYFDPYQMLLLAEELARLGFAITPCNPTPKVLQQQSVALREAVREGYLELYDDEDGPGNMLISDLLKTRVVDKSYGERLQWPEDEDGHGDRAAALCNVLPTALQALAVPPSRGQASYGGVPLPDGNLMGSDDFLSVVRMAQAREAEGQARLERLMMR